MRVALLWDTITISSCWTWYATDFYFPFLSPNYQICLVIRIWNNIRLLDLVWYWFFFLCFFNLSEQWESPYYQTLKQYQVAGLSMVMMLFLVFNLTEQWGSPCYQTLKQYQVAGLGMVLIVFGKFNLTEQWGSPFYQTLKQHQVAGLGTLLIFIFFFCHPTIRVAVLLEFETISGCWTWYGTDFFFCFFNLSEQWGSPYYQTLKQYQVPGLSMVMMFFLVFNLTEQWGSPCYQTLKQYQVAGLGMVLIVFGKFNLTEQWGSPFYQTLKQHQVAGLGTLLNFIFFFCRPTIRVAVLLEIETISGCWT